MAEKRLGKYTFTFKNSPVISGAAAVVGKKEGEGPLGKSFDKVSDDSFMGQKTWELAERVMQQEALRLALKKADTQPNEVAVALGGDLLNQCMSTAYAFRDADIPFLGLYGACSTMAEGMLLSAALIDGGYADTVSATTSSHFCTAERQYRMPLEYGGQRPPTAQWTATAAGAAVIKNSGAGPRITRATVGRITDMGIKDVGNMGAAMAPACVNIGP